MRQAHVQRLAPDFHQPKRLGDGDGDEVGVAHRRQRDEERARFENLTGDLLDEVVTLLRDEPRDGRDDGPVYLFGQAEPSQKV